MLQTCGTVVAKQRDRVIVRIEQERCANCTGCIRFNFPKNVSASGTQGIGERVVVKTSAVKLALASLLVFGLPVASLALAVLAWESSLLVGLALPLSLFVVYVLSRDARLKQFLKVHAESI